MMMMIPRCNFILQTAKTRDGGHSNTLLDFIRCATQHRPRLVVPSCGLAVLAVDRQNHITFA